MPGPGAGGGRPLSPSMWANALAELFLHFVFQFGKNADANAAASAAANAADAVAYVAYVDVVVVGFSFCPA